MGSADIILDLVSTGVTLRENNLKQIQGGNIMHSEGALVANRRALLERKVRLLSVSTWKYQPSGCAAVRVLCDVGSCLPPLCTPPPAQLHHPTPSC